MRYIFCFILVYSSFIAVSCSKQHVNEDAADAFVGSYSVGITQSVVWGQSTGTITDTGVLNIYKVSETRVQAIGPITSYGEIVGSMVYFEPVKVSDSAGYYTIAYGPGTLAGNVLTITANRSGQLSYNGILYPFRSSDQYIAIKQ